MRIFLFLSLLLLPALPARAMEGCKSAACSTCHTLTVQEAGELLKKVGEVKGVAQAPVKGLWEVQLEKDGRQGRVYVDFARKNVIAGTVFPADSPAVRNPSPLAGKQEKTDPSKISDSPLLLGNPRGKKRIIVFTDPDCPFCARFHEHLKSLVKQDPEVAVYIKLYPLPMHPDAYDTSRSILAAGSMELLERAFRREPVPRPEGEQGKDALEESMRLGRSLGITGTPTSVFPDGSIVSGARDPEALKKLLNAVPAK